MKKGSPGFDIVTINMAIMDIPTIEPLVRALPKLLAKDGMYGNPNITVITFGAD